MCLYIRCSCASRRQAVLDDLYTVSVPESVQQEPTKMGEELEQVVGQKKGKSEMKKEEVGVVEEEVGGLLKKEERGRKDEREKLEGLCLVEEEVVEEEIEGD